MKKWFHNLNNNFGYLILGLVVTLLGIDLWASPNYFFWPPEYASLMNDDGLDAIAVLVGIALIIYSGKKHHNNEVVGILLGISAAFLTIITIILAVHVYFAGINRLTIPVILGVGWILNVFKMARDHRIDQ